MEDEILALLKLKKRGLAFHQIAASLHSRGREQTRLRRALKLLEARGSVLRKKDIYLVPQDRTIVRGEFLPTPRGFGFVRRESGEGEDVFVPARHSLGALAGDTVEVVVKEKGQKGKPEGQVVRILKKKRETLLGVYQEHYGRPFIQPFDSASAEGLPLATRGTQRIALGAIIEAERDTLAVRNVFGLPDEPGVDVQVVIKRFGLVTKFCGEAAEEAEAVPHRISARDREGRKDYRRWPTVTIDGESAQDFDDAVSIKRLASGNFLLGVHIADVSHYVRPGSPLDRDALARATSVYLPDFTIPMLPEALSNDICSLRGRQLRLTVSVLLEIDGQGRVVKAEFHPSLIKTAERMTYASVFKIFQDDEAERTRYHKLVPDFLLMRELAAVLRRRREAQGSLNFDLLEPELIYREGTLQRVEAFEANEAHHLIEEFMVLANEAVAGYLSRKAIPALYRVHPPPALGDIAELKELLAHFGITLAKADKVTSRDLQRVLKDVEGKPDEKVIQSRVLRALRIAVYSPENSGHYGLAKKDYTHFTSPIRRYPDLVVHRALKAALAREKWKAPGLQSLALHCSDQERKADGAERELVEWRIFRFLKGKLGDEFEGIIVDITKAGVMVELEEYFVDGLIAYQDLGGDYYRQKSARTLVGRRSGRSFELGQRVTVMLAAVDPLARRMTLVLAPHQPGGSA
jgi:ribonuclease R